MNMFPNGVATKCFYFRACILIDEARVALDAPPPPPSHPWPIVGFSGPFGGRVSGVVGLCVVCGALVGPCLDL